MDSVSVRNIYKVRSKSSSSYYLVSYDHDKEYYYCTCPDFVHRCSKSNEMCKHIQQIKDLDDRAADPTVYKDHDIELITYQTESQEEVSAGSSCIDNETAIDNTQTAIDNESINCSNLGCATVQRQKEETVKVLLDICQKQQHVIQSSFDVSTAFATALLERMKV